MKTGKVAIKRGIFQGGSLSPLLFCLAFISLTNILNKQGAEYEFKKNKVSHLFYMDDKAICYKLARDTAGIDHC